MKYSLFKRLSNQAAASVPSGFSGDDWHRAYYEKFAELIVAECADIALKSGHITNKDILAKVEAERIYHKIKEHFGVEE